MELARIEVEVVSVAELLKDCTTTKPSKRNSIISITAA